MFRRRERWELVAYFTWLVSRLVQGGRKCSTVAPLRGTKATREAQRRRKRTGGKEKKGQREGEEE